MQLNSIYLYSNKIDIYTNVFAAPGSDNETWTTERYRKVYQRNFKAYRGVDNRFDLQIRNSDQRPSELPQETTLVFTLVDPDSQNLILEKDCDIISRTNGRVRLSIAEDDLDEIQTGNYQYSIYARSNSGRTTPLYGDAQSGAYGILEVLGDIKGEPQASTVIDNFTVIPETWPGVDFSSGDVIYASPELTTQQSVHTFVFYPNQDFTGTVKIQASAERGATPKQWRDLEVLDFPRDSRYVNIQGKWNWLRVIYGPSFNNSARFVIGQTSTGSYAVSVFDGGKNYSVGQQLTVPGDKLGGVSTANDLTITVTAVNFQGSIDQITFSGVSETGNRSYVIHPSSVTPIGTLDKVIYR
jgi:hypothetical protein